MADAARSSPTEERPVVAMAANDAAVLDGADIPDDNLVNAAVRTIIAVMDEIDELRAGLNAGGIPLQTSAALVEMGVRERFEARDRLIESSVSAAFEAHGSDGYDRERLVKCLERLVELEHDIAHERRLLRGQEIDVPSINLLAQLIRRNRSDGGARAAREFVSYAIACGLPIGDALARARVLTLEQASVLPKIPRPDPAARRNATWVREALWGTLIGVVLLLLMV